MSPDPSPTPPSDPPGADGDPAPSGTVVRRFGPQPSPKNQNEPGHALLAAGRAWPGLFAFSSAEQALERPRLSVWLSGLTTSAQAWRLVGAKPGNRILVRLRVDTIRTVLVTGEGDAPATPPLDVVWERATAADPTDSLGRVPETRDGWQGHCGIDGLYRGTKPQQRKLRSLLADTAQPGDLVILTDEQIVAFQASA